MQHYTDFARKHGVTLLEKGSCQFCGALTTSGVHECLEIFNFGFPELDLSRQENHPYKFFIVDAHTLQHPELHGRWNNHFHLTRLHLTLTHHIRWTYDRSPRLSDHLKTYKQLNAEEYLTPPPVLRRGAMTTTDIREANTSEECMMLIMQWAQQVYQAWEEHHHVADKLATRFLSTTY